MTPESTKFPTLRFETYSKNSATVTKFGKYVDASLYGPRFNAQDYDENGNVKTIRGTDVGSSGELKYDQIPTAQIDRKTVATHRLLEGDLVMITTAECGLTGVYREQDIPHIPSAYAVRLRLNSLAAPYYFKYFFQTQGAQRQIVSYVRKATVANLPGSDILKIKVREASLPEQRKIADFLTAVDGRIGQLIQKKALLTDYKKGVMQQLFTQAIRFKDDHGNDFPDWEEKKLGDIALKKSSSITAGSLSDMAGEYLVYGAAGEMASIESFAEDREFIGIVKDGAGVGRTMLCKPYTSVLGTMDIVKEKPGNHLRFIFGFMNLLNFKKHVMGSTIPHIYFKDYSREDIAVPSFDEQTKIADFLSAIDRKIKNLTTQITETQTFKRGLLQQMFV